MTEAAPQINIPKRLLFVEQYYYPDGWGGAEIPLDITRHLKSLGYEVVVLSGSDPYAAVLGDPGPDPASIGIRILRVPRLLPGDIKRWKLARQLWFYLVSAIVLTMRRPPDLFIAQTNPPLGVVLVAIAATLWRRPSVIIAQDLYPEALVAHGAIAESSLPGRVLGAVFGWAYRRARCVVAVGEQMRERLVAKRVPTARIQVISNWATGPQSIVRGPSNALVAAWGAESRFVVMYSGNLGAGHEFTTLLDGLALCARDVPELLVIFVGRGSRLAEVKAGVEARGLSRLVRFQDYVPAAQLPSSLGLADLAVVTLKPGFEGLIVPSKLLGYMARGLPVLYVGPEGDTSGLVRRAACGYVIADGDAASVARTITLAARDRAANAARGAAGQQFYERHLARRAALARYADVIGDSLDWGNA